MIAQARPVAEKTDRTMICQKANEPMIQFLKSRFFTWALLALPSVMMLAGYLNGSRDAHDMLHPTGEFAARAMILAMMCSPLFALFPKARIVQSLLKRRRYIGVAAFGYAALHTAFYLIDKGSFAKVVEEMLVLSIWTGWLAFLIFVPIAATSNNWAVRALGSRWKQLQRWVYAAAILTAAHWLFLEYEVVPVLVHFLPLAVLQILRVRKNRQAVPV